MEPPRGKPEAAAAVWRWKDPPPSAGRARLGALWRAAIGFVAAAVLFYFSRPVAAAVVASIAGLTFLLGLVSPLVAYAALLRGLDRLGAIVARAVAWLLIAPLFYLVLAPFGLLARRGARDRLGRRFDRTARSYWTERNEQTPIDRPY